MDYVVLVKNIIESITDDSFDITNENGIIKVLVTESDYGKLIGKGGATINAIRTVVDEAASMHNDGFIKIEVEKREN